MDIITSIQEWLKNPWIVLGLSAAILFLGWILSQWIASFTVRLLHRSGFINLLIRRLNFAEERSVDRFAHNLIRIAIILASLWGAWSTVNTHADLGSFITTAGQAVGNFIQLPLVLFLLNLFLVGLATILLSRLFGWIRSGFEAVARRLEAEKGNRLKGFKFQSVQIFTAEQLTSFLLGVNRYLRYVVNILLFLIYLTGVFSVFPQTRGIVTNVLASLTQIIQLGWQSFINYLPSLLNLIIIVLVTYYFLKLIRFVFGEIEKGTIAFAGFHRDWAIPTYQLLRFVVIALALVIAFPYLPGSGSPAFQGVSVFVGLLFSLGSTSVVSNIVSGVVLTYTRSFRVGDRVKIADTIGDIIEKGLLVTRVRTIKNVEITIPNSMVMSSHIVNYSAVSKERGLILNTTITLGYDISWRLIHQTLIKAAQATNGILSEPRPFVLQTSLDDFYVSYELNAYTDQPNKMAVVYSELHQNIQDACNEAGIEILSPHYKALRDGNQSTIPADYLPKDYQAPPFNLRVKPNKEKTE